MNCADRRELVDSFVSEELPAEARRDMLRHLETCPECRADVEARRRLRGALRTAFDRAPDLQPTGEFRDRLRRELSQAAVRRGRFRLVPGRWLALAAGVVLVAGLSAAVMLRRSSAPEALQARDAIGDHRNCALKYRLVRTPVPLEEAAQRFDAAFRVLMSAPPDDIPTPDGPARVVERHSCEFGEHRFGHVIMKYRGRVVSLLVTSDQATAAAISADGEPRVIGSQVEGLKVVSVNGSRHAVMLVSDLEEHQLTQLARVVSLPLVQHLAGRGADPTALTASLVVRPLRPE